ncbi:EF-hand domain-containing protein [Bradyrhizobium sp. STM 3562]|uniref:EF-hand domain-containing protein n=1 Tax=Bradyrhizobium sp. STM 3562 TaxID=578924 RepID=UPI0038909B22
MFFALGAAASLLDGLQSLTSSTSSTQSTGSQSGGSAFALPEGASPQTSDLTSGAGFSRVSPETMNELIAIQSQSGLTTTTATSSPSDSLKDLFSQIDANGDGQITKSEFENALGAGGSNVAQADSVFGQLDSNGDGSVSLGELKSALQGAGGHHGGHHHVADVGDSAGTDSGATSGGSDADPLMQALDGASSSAVTNSDGSTTTTITYADGSKVTMTTPAASTSSNSAAASAASSSYNWIEKMIQGEAKALSAQPGSALLVSA